jgi:predicted Zn-dependent peptidase
MVEEKFVNLPKIKAATFKKFSAPEKVTEKLVIREKDTDQYHLMLGLYALERNSPQRYIQSILNTILGSGISSRMFQKIREEKSLAYYVDTDIDVYKDTGLFTVSAGVNKEKLEEAIAGIIFELEKIKKPGDISDKELRKAKDNLRGHLILRLEESLDRAMFFGLQLVLENKTRTLEEIIAGIEDVTVSDVSNLANKLFQQDRYHLSLVGKNIESEKIEKILR